MVDFTTRVCTCSQPLKHALLHSLAVGLVQQTRLRYSRVFTLYYLEFKYVNIVIRSGTQGCLLSFLKAIVRMKIQTSCWDCAALISNQT